MTLVYILVGSIADAIPYVPLALGLVWTLRYQRVADLSLAASFAFGAGLFAFAAISGWSIGACLILGLAAGASVGLVAGVATNYLKVDGLLSGIITLFVFHGVALTITQGTLVLPGELNPLTPLQTMERSLDVQKYLPLQTLALGGVGAILLVGTTWLLRSEWGCAFRALQDTRGGRDFLRSNGISAENTSVGGFILGGVVAAASGIMLALQTGQATASLGLDALIEVFPAYLLGVGLFSRDFEHGATQRNASIFSQIIVFVRRMPTEHAATTGIFIYFLFIGMFHLFTPARWAPRVLVGLAVLVLLGGGGGLRLIRERKLLRSTTKISVQGNLEISDLSVEFMEPNGSKLRVINSLSVHAASGEVVEIVGDNGVGKSTLLRALSGRLVADGSFTIPMRAAGWDKSKGRRAIVLYLPQDARDELCAGLTALEHWIVVAVGRRPSCLRKSSARVPEVLQRVTRSRVGLNIDQPIETLSGGQKRRVLLGRLELADHGVLVIAIDEPFADLDSDGGRLTVALLKRFAAEGGIIVFVDHTHRLVPDRRYILRLGRAELLSA